MCSVQSLHKRPGWAAYMIHRFLQGGEPNLGSIKLKMQLSRVTCQVLLMSCHVLVLNWSKFSLPLSQGCGPDVLWHGACAVQWHLGEFYRQCPQDMGKGCGTAHSRATWFKLHLVCVVSRSIWHLILQLLSDRTLTFDICACLSSAKGLHAGAGYWYPGEDGTSAEEGRSVTLCKLRWNSINKFPQVPSETWQQFHNAQARQQDEPVPSTTTESSGPSVPTAEQVPLPKPSTRCPTKFLGVPLPLQRLQCKLRHHQWLRRSLSNPQQYCCKLARWLLLSSLFYFLGAGRARRQTKSYSQHLATQSALEIWCVVFTSHMEFAT